MSVCSEEDLCGQMTATAGSNVSGLLGCWDTGILETEPDIYNNSAVEEYLGKLQQLKVWEREKEGGGKRYGWPRFQEL